MIEGKIKSVMMYKNTKSIIKLQKEIAEETNEIETGGDWLFR